MATKPNARNWNDVQLFIVSLALVLTLVLWNTFAGPDRVKAEANNSTASSSPASATPVPTDTVALTPTLLPEIKIMFASGTSTPQVSPPVPVPPPPRRGGGGGGGGTGGGGTGGS